MILSRYAYEKQIFFQDIETALEVVTLTLTYKIQGLFYAAIDHIGRHLSLDQALKIVSAINVSVFRHQALGIIRDNIDELINSKKHCLLTVEDFKRLVIQVHQLLRPIDLFELVHSWSKNVCRSVGNQANPSNVRGTMQQFLPYIMFLQLTPKDFVNRVVSTEILTAEEVGAISANLGNSDGRLGYNRQGLTEHTMLISRQRGTKFLETFGAWSCVFSVSEKAYLASFSIEMISTNEVPYAVHVELRSDGKIQREVIYISERYGRFGMKLVPALPLSVEPDVKYELKVTPSIGKLGIVVRGAKYIYADHYEPYASDSAVFRVKFYQDRLNYASIDDLDFSYCRCVLLT